MDDRNERTAIIGSPSSGGSDRGYAQAHNALNAGVHSPMQARKLCYFK